MEELTNEEFEIFTDTSFMLLKQQVYQKLESCLSQVRSELKLRIGSSGFSAGEDISFKSAKISKGENHHAYPYRVLDFPAFYEKDDFFMFRTVILWGHPIACHIILSGRFKDRYQERISLIDDETIFLNISTNAWKWIRDENTEIALINTNASIIESKLQQLPFIKCSSYFPFISLKEVIPFAINCWDKWEKALG